MRPWSEALDPDRLNSLRLLVALHPRDAEVHDTAKTAHLVLARVLADMGDLDEAAIASILAAATPLTVGAPEYDGPYTLSSALNRTLRAKIDPRLVLATLAGAVLRSHETLQTMERAGEGSGGYSRRHMEGQRRDAAMTLRAFRAWERTTS